MIDIKRVERSAVLHALVFLTTIVGFTVVVIALALELVIQMALRLL